MVSKNRKTAFCSMMAALSVVLLLLGSLIPGATYSAPILGMLPLIPTLSELGYRPALRVYVTAAVLAVLLVPDKEAAGIYVVLGYYPVLRPVLDRIHFGILRILSKAAVCTLSVTLLYAALLFLFRLDVLRIEFSGYSNVALAILLIGGNVVFLLLDQALERLTLLWCRRLRRLFFPLR